MCDLPLKVDVISVILYILNKEWRTVYLTSCPFPPLLQPHLSLKAGQRHISINLLWIIKFLWVSVRNKVEDICPSQAHLVYRWGLMFLKGCYKINSPQKRWLLKWMTAQWFARSASQISHTVKHNPLHTAVCLLLVLIIYTVCFMMTVSERLLPIVLIHHHDIWSWLRLIACLLKEIA